MECKNCGNKIRKCESNEARAFTHVVGDGREHFWCFGEWSNRGDFYPERNSTFAEPVN